eukprot:9486474-Pyramimonas_sp.AAC.1
MDQEAPKEQSSCKNVKTPMCVTFSPVRVRLPSEASKKRPMDIPMDSEGQPSGLWPFWWPSSSIFILLLISILPLILLTIRFLHSASIYLSSPSQPPPPPPPHPAS